MSDTTSARMRQAHDCPRCGYPPHDVTRMGDADTRWIPRCPCYPHPPLCISCRTPLEDSRCMDMDCPTPFVIQPLPITDPLFSEEYRL